MLHGDDLAEFLQGVNVPDLVHELHTAENISNMQIIVRNDRVWKLKSLLKQPYFYVLRSVWIYMQLDHYVTAP